MANNVLLDSGQYVTMLRSVLQPWLLQIKDFYMVKSLLSSLHWGTFQVHGMHI